METPTANSVTMKACVLRAGCGELLVRDLSTGQEVQVHTDQACCFSAGQTVCIIYNGAMTLSLPPQIHGDSICRVSGC